MRYGIGAAGELLTFFLLVAAGSNSELFWRFILEFFQIFNNFRSSGKIPKFSKLKKFQNGSGVWGRGPVGPAPEKIRQK